MACKTCGFAGAQPGVPCPKCGNVSVEQQYQTGPQGPGPTIIVQTTGAAPVAEAPKSKIVAGLLGIFLGGLGIHRFYLGYSGLGAAMLILQILGWLTWCFLIGIFISIGVGIWGLIEGVLILVGVINRDGFGRPLIG
jgi:TM2 domain-containing membrane protein YozV